MGFWLSVITVFMLQAVSDVWSQEECVKTVVTSCDECINSGPYCAWCKSLAFTKTGEQDAVRCNTRAALKERGCEDADIISPQGKFNPLVDRKLNKGSAGQEPVQLQPQEVQLDLRPGQPTKFSFKFKRAEDYPVDLYYLMDLSYSMKDDLQNVKSLGNALLTALKKITTKARIGFGSFVDKVALPFTNTNPAKVQKPCPDDESYCQPAFGFQHVLSLTDNEKDFNSKVSAQYISGNLDTPEGGLDAMLQVAVCGNKIGWGNSTRLLVLTTDAGFHMAGDGKLGAILEPNDGLCHLDSSLKYSKSSEMDYPSVGQVTQKLSENNIQPIFAVTKDMEPVYTKLKQIIPKSEVGVLTSDSSNVISLIANAYKALSSNVIVTHDDLPEDVTVMYTSNCANANVPSVRGTCNNVGIGQEVEFTAIVTAKKCMNQKSFQIGPLGFREKMKVTVRTKCQCECGDQQNQKNDHCNKEGQVTCGTCSCNKEFVGQKCECKVGERNEAELQAACRQGNGSLCSGQGECVCGRCQCFTGEDGRAIYGTYCECDDRSCPIHNKQLCGGNGKCACGRCRCDAEHEGDACNCKKSNDGCRTGGTVCSGRGNCVCNICNCTEGYTRPLCETCPGCISPCGKLANCVECKTTPTDMKKNCTGVCQKITIRAVAQLPDTKDVRRCRWRGTDGCWMSYTAKELHGIDVYEVAYLEEKECPQPPPIATIIGGAFAGVALIGLLLLMLLKALIYMKDLKEFRRFENEKKKAKWSNADNPLFKTATTTVQNPNFSEE